ncbi:COPB2 [Hepatospora eriocheir]|uniref:COPB2 n=1 Tax=Hepatospora eriocheir TaxID=1081669 RepID=A0A1X0Q8G1_9MICR|nr:COPB2 [Hepatospora eriocheir]
MQLLNKQINLRTEKVKALETLEGYPYIVAGLYSGDILLLTITDTLEIVKSVRISDCPVRAVAISNSKKFILAGNDEGNVIILDSESLQVIKIINAHKDFIRSITISDYNSCFITSSDDCTVKLYDLNNFTCKQHYKDLKHYVMDTAFDRTEPVFYTACLDGKIRVYSIHNNKRIDTLYCRTVDVEKSKGIKSVIKNISKKKITTNFKSFNNLSGLNSVKFISDECFATVNDDGFLTIYDKNRKSVVMANKLFNHQGNKVKSFKYENEELFGAVSCDGNCYIFKDYDNVIGSIETTCKIWDLCFYKNHILIGTDFEIIANQISVDTKLVRMSNDRIFTLSNSSIYMQKVEDMIEKDLGTLSNIKDIIPSQNGKFLGVIFNDNVCNIGVYSILGLRKKLFVNNAYDIKFDKKGCVYIHKKDHIIKYDERFNEIYMKKIKSNESMLFISENKILLKTKTGIELIENNEDGKKILEINESGVKSGVVLNENIILFTKNGIIVYKDNKKVDDNSINDEVTDYLVYDNTLVVLANYSLYFLLIGKEKIIKFPIRKVNISVSGKLLGAYNNEIFYLERKIDRIEIDKEYLDWQCEVLNGNLPLVKDSFRHKAISFYESQGMYEESLKLCVNDNQKFEILVKLGDFNKAEELANSEVKFNRLGKAYLEEFKKTKEVKYLTKSSDCFYKSNDFTSLVLTDSFSNKKYLKEVGKQAKQQGQFNLSFMAYYKNKDYKICSELLKDTIYYELFRKNYQ